MFYVSDGFAAVSSCSFIAGVLFSSAVYLINFYFLTPIIHIYLPLTLCLQKLYPMMILQYHLNKQATWIIMNIT